MEARHRFHQGTAARQPACATQPTTRRASPSFARGRMRLAAQRTRCQSGHGRFFRVALSSSESAFLIALIDSGASYNFISASLVAYLRLRVKNLPTPCHIRAANGGLMHCTHYVVVRASLGELRFTLTPRVVPTDLRVILPPSPSRGGGKYTSEQGQLCKCKLCIIMHFYATWEKTKK